jgi:hypothetical protein
MNRLLASIVVPRRTGAFVQRHAAARNLTANLFRLKSLSITFFEKLVPAEADPIKNLLVLLGFWSHKSPHAAMAVGEAEYYGLPLNRVRAPLNARM